MKKIKKYGVTNNTMKLNNDNDKKEGEEMQSQETTYCICV
jgi:hypothetical protein